MARTLAVLDNVLNGQLADRLRADRARGLTHERIAEDLRSEGIDVSRESVRRYLKKLEAAA